MKLLSIVVVAALTAYGGMVGTARAAPAAGLFTGAPIVRTLATPAPNTSVEKAWWYRRHYWHRWHRWHYWHPYYHRYHYWHRWHRWHYWHRYW